MPIDAHWSHFDWFCQSWSCERLMRNTLSTCELISRKLISREDTYQTSHLGHTHTNSPLYCGKLYLLIHTVSYTTARTSVSWTSWNRWEWLLRLASDVKEVNESICILARTQFSVAKHLDFSSRVEEVLLTLVTTFKLVSHSVPSIGIAGSVTWLLLQQYATCQLRVDVYHYSVIKD